MAGKTALVLGATGATGSHILKQLIASNDYVKVGEFGRRVTPGIAQEKLKQEVIDFEKLDPAAFKKEKWDVVYVACV